MPEKNYSIKEQSRGEELIYKDRDLEIALNHTYCNGLRLYCNDTSVERGLALEFAKRRQIIENLCDYFNTKRHAFIFVLDERDKDRAKLENLFAELVAQGHKITIDYDSAEKREHVIDDMYLSFLKAGKKLKINGVEINTIEDYWRWKKTH